MLVRNSSDLIAVVDNELTLIYASPAAERMLGYVPAEQVGRSLLDLIHPDDLEATARSFFTEALKPGIHPVSVFRFRTAAGEWRVLEVIATNCLDDPAVAGIVMNARDITERTNLTRALRTLGMSNHVLVNASEEASLLSDSCKIIVDAGSYRLAWVGYIEDDNEHSVRPVASAGTSDYLNKTVIHWSDDDYGRGPTGVAIRTRNVQVIDDVITATTFAPWLAAAAENGVRSSCALPLEVKGEVIGALSIYAAEPGAFGPPEVALLKELADALAYGIGRIRDADMLEASEERFRSLAGAAPIGILEVSSGAVVDYANPRVAEITGRGIEALMGRSWIEAVHPEDKSELIRLVDNGRSDGATLAAKFRIERPEGDIRHVRMLAAPKGDSHNGYVVTIEDATEEVEARDALSYQAFYDNLTGLPNRALFLDRLNQELARHRRGSSTIAVLFLDLDRFKLVNDSLGHESGDIVLREVGNRFKQNIRAGETAARLSGDEFAFIIRDIHKVENAVAATKRVQALLEPSIQCPGQELTVTASVGIVIPASGADAPTVLRDADAAMYQAKEEGRNRYALFDESLHRRSVERLAVESDLRQAILRHEFELYYQPIVDPSSGRPTGAEALLRWHHPTRGLVPPLEFIPVAEDSGLIRPIGQWVFDRAMSQMAEWDAQPDGPSLDPLTVNFSSKQLDDPETSDLVREALKRNGIDPRRVCVEVTESVVMADSAPTRHSLECFKHLGLRVAIDDFGTGYSSLAYLHSLPVTTVKVDRTFVERLGTTDDSMAVVKAVVEMSHALGLRVVAEGVRNEQLAAIVSMLGCDSAQGYFWSRPMPAGEFAEWWSEADLRAVALSSTL
jgi:diguanylate cyclase (GGDEF)-like protein/PAS domain S-box-containing protein